MAKTAIENHDRNWSPSAVHVRRCLKWIKGRGGRVTPEELVSWDAAHGRQLFEWNDKTAAAEWRLQQARVFLNSFRGIVDGMRVRAFINIPASDETGLEERQYVSMDVISEHGGMRQWIIDNLTRRLKSIASELRMLKLSEDERRAIIQQLWDQMSEQDDSVKRAS